MMFLPHAVPADAPIRPRPTPSMDARRGKTQYLKTTLTGMTGTALDYVMLVVSGMAGVQRMTREHLAIARALQVRFSSRAMYPPGPTKGLLRQGVIMPCVVVKDGFLCDLLPGFAPRIPIPIAHLSLRDHADTGNLGDLVD